MKYIISTVVFLLLFTGCAKTPQPSQSVPVSKSAGYKAKPVSKSKAQAKPQIKKEDSIFTLTETKEPSNTIAVIYPSYDIGKYALDAINSINAYLIFKKESFKLELYDIKNQTKENFENIFATLKEKNINKAVALFTNDFFKNYEDYQKLQDMKIYFPLVNRDDHRLDEDIKNSGSYIFGAISYKNQIDKLIAYSSQTRFIDLYDNSSIGKTIHGFMKQNSLTFAKEVDQENGKYKNFLKFSNGFEDSTVFLNTPIIKSSILLSQITAQELNVRSFLSTQLNYSPLIFSLTQKRDRKNIVVANSIGYIPDELLEVSNLTNSDLQYNWVNYSSIVGVEYLTSENIDFFKDLKIEENQVAYPVYLYKAGRHSFKRIRF